MEKNKLISVIMTEIQRADYVVSLLESVMRVMVRTGALKIETDVTMIATSIEVLIKSDLFAIVLAKILTEIGARNETKPARADWSGGVYAPPAESPVRSAPVDRL